jgi:hypothetical protein
MITLKSGILVMLCPDQQLAKIVTLLKHRISSSIRMYTYTKIELKDPKCLTIRGAGFIGSFVVTELLKKIQRR